MFKYEKISDIKELKIINNQTINYINDWYTYINCKIECVVLGKLWNNFIDCTINNIRKSTVWSIINCTINSIVDSYVKNISNSNITDVVFSTLISINNTTISFLKNTIVVFSRSCKYFTNRNNFFFFDVNSNIKYFFSDFIHFINYNIINYIIKFRPRITFWGLILYKFVIHDTYKNWSYCMDNSNTMLQVWHTYHFPINKNNDSIYAWTCVAPLNIINDYIIWSWTKVIAKVFVPWKSLYINNFTWFVPVRSFKVLEFLKLKS